MKKLFQEADRVLAKIDATRLSVPQSKKMYFSQKEYLALATEIDITNSNVLFIVF